MKIVGLKVTFKRPTIEAETTFETLKDLSDCLREEGSELALIFGSDMETVVQSVAGAPETGGEATAPEPTATAADAAPKKRGRPAKNANQPDPATVTAPAPMPIPSEVSPPTVPHDTTPTASGIPAFLDRTVAPAAPVAAAAPPPPPPPAPAPVPPSGILAGKVIGALDVRATDDANKKMLADWLAQYGLVQKGSSYDASIEALRLMADDKLAQVATALAVS